VLLLSRYSLYNSIFWAQVSGISSRFLNFEQPSTVVMISDIFCHRSSSSSVKLKSVGGGLKLVELLRAGGGLKLVELLSPGGGLKVELVEPGLMGGNIFVEAVAEADADGEPEL